MMQGTIAAVEGTDDNEGTCYCGRPRRIIECELFCGICERFFHLECLRNLPKQEYRICLFWTGYTFKCSDCNPLKEELWKARKAGRVYQIITTIAILTVNRTQENVESGLISKVVIPNPGTQWFTTNQITSFLHENLHRISSEHRSFTKSFDSLLAEVSATLDAYPSAFKKKPLYNDSYALNIELSKICPKLLLKPCKKVPAKNQKLLKNNRRFIKQREGENLPSACPAESVPLNGLSCHNFAAEPDPHSFIVRRLDKTELYLNYTFRLALESTVRLSYHDRAEGLDIGNSGLGVTGKEGYRTVRATHSVSRGTWYYEAVITSCPENSDACVRIGWSRQEAPLACTLGYKKLSYAIRSKKGTKFHNRIGRSYYKPGFKENDIIGVLIHLPEEPTRPLCSYLAPSRKKSIGFGVSHRFFRENSDFSSIHANLKDDVDTTPGSRIEFFVNGTSCGIAFQDIYRGFYFPSVSLYGYKNSPTVEFNFGQEMKFLPPGAKPMSERPDEVACEVALNDMVDLLDAESKLLNKVVKREIIIKEEIVIKDKEILP